MAEFAVIDEIGDNPVDTLADQEDPMDYREWIKAVEDPFHQFRHLIYQARVKREALGVDQAEIDRLKERKEAITKRFTDYKSSLRNKAKELCQTSPVNTAELDREK